jgi:hypothetical protein
MSQVIQAKCPHCQNVLRIPEEWLAQAMRCKRCRNIFMAKTKSNTSPTPSYPVAAPAVSVPAPIPTAKPAHAAPAPQPAMAMPVAHAPAPPHDPFGFDVDEPSQPSFESTPRRRKRGNSLLLLLTMFFVLFLAGLGGVGYVGYRIYEDAQKNDPSYVNNDATKKDGTPLVAKNGKNGDAPIVTPPINGDSAKDKKKVLPPLKDSTAGKTDGKKKPAFTNDPFPRRALLISVNNYLMFNTVHYGSPQDQQRRPEPYPGSSTVILRDRLTRPPMNFPVSQVFELSDGIPSEYKSSKAHSTQKSVLETTITDFLTTSREQDRIMIFFAGHGAHVEDKSYLVPIDGNFKNMDSLLPLKWVYDQMAKCKAQQKILVLDVFRYSPSRGMELPSPGEGEEGKMLEGFDKDLMNPPAGVQVWSSCVKDQSSVELDEGSAFLQALCNTLQGGGKMAGIATPPQPIPLDDMVTEVNDRLKKLLTAEKRTQVSRLTGTVQPKAVEYNASEELAKPITLKPPTAVGGEAAGAATIERILEEMRIMPVVRDTRAGDLNLLRAQNLPAFPVKVVDGYKPDGYQNITELHNKYKKDKEAFAKDFPLRAAYFDALEVMEESKKIQMREVLSSPVDPKRKAAFLLEQEPLGISIFKLEQMLAEMKSVAEKREMETSKRWQANFDYMHARVYGRVVYLYEYNYTLGKIRGDDLPELAPGQTGWRVGISGAKITVPDQKAKGFAKDVQKLWKRIQDDYSDTPWSLLAQRESMIALGLAWRPKSD